MLHNVPTRAMAGAYILDAGISKLSADVERAKGVHAMAAGTYPFLASVPPERFVRALAIGEITLAGALLAPFVSDRRAGLGLSAFAAGLLGLYLKTPGMRREHSLRPSGPGVALAKDSWLLGIGLSLLTQRRHHRHEEPAA